MKKKIIIIQKLDQKSVMWANSIVWGDEFQLIPVKGSPCLLVFYVFKFLLLGSRPSGVVFRYLNDYKSLFKTLVRLVCECLSVFICKIFDIKIGWICHNVNKETIENYPKITSIRRKILVKASDRFFVTDQLLITYFCKKFNIPNELVGVTCFGTACSFSTKPDDSSRFFDLIKTWRAAFLNRTGGQKKAIGLWIGELSEKKVRGIALIPKIIDAASSINCDIGFVIVGPIGNLLKKTNKDLYNYLKSSDNCLFIDKHVSIPSNLWKRYFDFIWKVYEDFSVPLTAYRAVEAGLPIVTVSNTFLSQLIKNYSIGYVLNDLKLDIQNLVFCIENWTTSKESEFLNINSWDKGAIELKKLVYM